MQLNTCTVNVQYATENKRETVVVNRYVSEHVDEYKEVF